MFQAQSVFTQMFPEEEFLPRAPDPDEIVFDNAGAEPTEGDNFGNKGSEYTCESEAVDGRQNVNSDANDSKTHSTENTVNEVESGDTSE